ncbi:peptidase C39 family protein [Streptomyces sp. NPDC048361]|uniref:peptidase C39 family protein n=1 Tax=Streptomyces sp. NPDC048361 TaxID=3154720 RepID=UPI003428FA8C
MTGSTPRRTVLAAAVAVAAGAAVTSSGGPATAAASGRPSRPRQGKQLVDNQAWTTHAQWRSGTAHGVRAEAGRRPGIVIDRPAGTTRYTDPHTGTSATWEYASWTSPSHRSTVPATEAVAHWNAHTPAGTWLQIELLGTYTDGTETPAYVMGRWTAGDGDADIRRTSVDGQGDGKSSISTDTFAIDAPATGLRLAAYRLRITLYRRPGSRLTPVVWRLGAMASDIPDRFTVDASTPGFAGELAVPSYSQEIHKGQYPQYDNGGEAWCSPTSSQMIIEHWGRKPSPADLAWVDPSYADPQVCQAARGTYDYQYAGCGNWPFNAAYAATYRDMSAVVTRLRSLNDVERLVRAGIPAITSQSFLATELTGAGYGTSGHLMTVTGFTDAGDVIAHDPAAPDDSAVRRVYKRREFENIWLRTKRYNASGNVSSGTGGVCYLYWPAEPTARQRTALAAVGLG